MAKSTDNQRPRPGRPGAKSSEVSPIADWSLLYHRIWLGIVAAVFLSRFFLPVEGAAQGDTLWIAGLWFLCGIAWALSVTLKVSPRIRFDWLDGAIALWIGGQVAAALVVILTAGEKRLAANMAWEWLAIGVSWVILRHGIVQPTVRQAFLRAVIVTGVVLAGYGLYQHYVEHPQLVAEYGPLFDKLRTATGSEAEAIKRKLAQDSVPTEGPALILFEKRLRDSREPLGLFALANTFGGCLAVCLLLTLGEILAVRRRKAGVQVWAPLFVAAALIGWCLLLTKSRTAWIGCACGMATLILPHLRLVSSYRRFLIPGVLASLAVVGVAAVLFVFGGLDRQVLSEAPKSVAYRLQYWQASSRLIAHRPWLGVGPGNFRQHYLQYKLPEASEEIADPHNLLFDIAATGGALSLLGMVSFLAFAIVKVFKDASDGNTAPTTEVSSANVGMASATRDPIPESVSSRFVFWMAGGGIAIAFFGLLFCWGQWEDRLLVLGLFWYVSGWWFAPRGIAGTPESTDPFWAVSIGAFAAAVALAVHLLGAGGISMPGVTQTLIMLVAFSLVPSQASSPELAATRLPARSWIGPTSALACCGMLIGLTVTALVPVLRCRGLLDRGNTAGWSGSAGGRETALQDFRDAAMADPWSPDPWRHQFEWSGGDGFRSNDSFETAVKHLQEAMRRDPVNFWAPRTLGNLWLNRWQVTRLPEDAGPAVIWLDKAHVLYPTNSAITAELATALAANQEQTKAAAMAQSALKQDDIYHQQGHVDRYLVESRRQQLEELAGNVPSGSKAQK